MWIDSCVTEDGIKAFVAFLVTLLLALIQFSLLALSNVCDNGNPPGLFGLVLIPTDCRWGGSNDHFEGDAAFVMVAALHAVIIAVPVFVLLVSNVIFKRVLC